MSKAIIVSGGYHLNRTCWRGHLLNLVRLFLSVDQYVLSLLKFI